MDMVKVEVSGRVSPYPMPVAILGVIADGKPNFMTIAWFNRFNGNPSIWGIGIGKGKLTLEAIEKHREFSINFPSSKQVVEADYCGIRSGRDVDKAALFKVFRGTLENTPMIQECPLNLELKFHELVDLPKAKLVLGEVITSYSEDKYLSNGRLDPKKIDPILLTQPDNHYWSIGEIVGDAFAIGKKLETR
jgi:flavin reductase (DIM6/NTAB) family NADH-FMN oxidoreductase RutF